jgi:hypothetical protein
MSNFTEIRPVGAERTDGHELINIRVKRAITACIMLKKKKPK